MENRNDRSMEDTSPLTAAQPYVRPEGMPEAARSWRENMAALAPQIAKSPLPTRQLKRMAARALSKGLSSVAKVHHRRDAVMQKRRDRAEAAQVLYNKIKNHAPTAK